jgi:ABC-type iron transport system FetAB permease component
MGLISKLTNWGLIAYDTVVMCLISVVFQYLVVHWVLKQITHTKGRALFLLVLILSTGVASLVGLVLLSNVNWTAGLEEIKSQLFFYRYVYIVATSAFIGGSMARRVFIKHG